MTAFHFTGRTCRDNLSQLNKFVGGAMSFLSLPTASSDQYLSTPDRASPAYVAPLWYKIAERVLCAVILIIIAPLILLLLALIRLETPGSPLFKQQRIATGGGRPFSFYKIRTMYADSRERFPDFCSYAFAQDEVADVKLSLENDPRVTRLGRFLRRTSLDELPNLLNIVAGDMALVGPRPEMWVMLPYYDERTLAKFSVKPGLTGYAQIFGRGELTFAQTNELDLAYVRDASLRTDLRVLRMTVAAVVLQKGAH